MPGPGTLAHLPIPQEERDALLYLYNAREPYPHDTFIQPLRKATGRERERTLSVVLTIHGRGETIGAGPITGVWIQSGDQAVRVPIPAGGEGARAFSDALLTKAHRGTLFVVPDGTRGAFAGLLDQLAPWLIQLGYIITPIFRGGSIGWFRVTKSKHAWTFCDPEVMSGLPINRLLEWPSMPVRARRVGRRLALDIAMALGKWAQWLRREFRIAPRPSAAMAAIAAVRQYLPDTEWKWAPSAFLVSMERNGYGYRAGIQYARRHKGSSHRVDITRQYTGALACELPLRTAFGPAHCNGRVRDGVYLCRVRIPRNVRYPLGWWDSQSGRFRHSYVSEGRYLSVLHTSELPGLQSLGADVDVGWGFVYTHTFRLDGYVRHLQTILTRWGRTSPIAEACKLLGNAVYGKLAEEPRRRQLRLSTRPTGKSWYPFVDMTGRDWPNIWERTREHFSSTQHIDIAAHITAAARSDTAQLWAALDAAGCEVLRVHTDSVTTKYDPRAYVITSHDTIGGVRYEGQTTNGCIVGAAMFSDEHGVHFSGASNVTAEDVRMLYEGHSITVYQECKSLPMTGRPRIERVAKRYRVSRLSPEVLSHKRGTVSHRSPTDRLLAGVAARRNWDTVYGPVG